jgi:hypothetical protein
LFCLQISAFGDLALSGICGCFRTSSCHPLATSLVKHVIKEGGISNAIVQQMNVGPQGKSCIGVPKPLLHLLDVPPIIE